MPSIRTIWYQPFSRNTASRAAQLSQTAKRLARFEGCRPQSAGNGRSMRFRLFFIDKLTRRIISLIELEAADAVEAVALAEERRAQSGMEIWAKGGLIKRWDERRPIPPLSSWIEGSVRPPANAADGTQIIG